MRLREALHAGVAGWHGRVAQRRLDDAATGQGLLNFFLRGVTSGAITEEDAVAMTGLSVDELRGRSFVKILENRSAA